MRRILIVFCAISIISCSSTPTWKAEPQPNDIKGFTTVKDLVYSIEAMPGKKYKGRLDVKDAHMILSGLDYSFRTPVDHYKINIKNTASVIINVISMGNMLGFNKTIAFPMVILLDQNGNEMKGNRVAYEVWPADMEGPMRIFASWKYRIESPGEYSVLVFADMSSTKGTTVTTSYGGILEKTLLKGYPVGRAAYAEYTLETRVE